MFHVGRPHIDHMQAVVRVGCEANLSRLAAGERRGARILAPDVHGVRDLSLLVPTTCITTSGAINVSRLLEVLVFLLQFFRV